MTITTSNMKYEIRRHGKKYKIYEIPTKQYIHYTYNSRDAKDMCNSLNRGSGFDGNTPAFLARG